MNLKSSRCDLSEFAQCCMLAMQVRNKFGVAMSCHKLFSMVCMLQDRTRAIAKPAISHAHLWTVAGGHSQNTCEGAAGKTTEQAHEAITRKLGLAWHGPRNTLRHQPYMVACLLYGPNTQVSMQETALSTQIITERLFDVLDKRRGQVRLPLV